MGQELSNANPLNTNNPRGRNRRGRPSNNRGSGRNPRPQGSDSSGGSSGGEDIHTRAELIRDRAIIRASSLDIPTLARERLIDFISTLSDEDAITMNEQIGDDFTLETLRRFQDDIDEGRVFPPSEINRRPSKIDLINRIAESSDLNEEEQERVFNFIQNATEDQYNSFLNGIGDNILTIRGISDYITANPLPAAGEVAEEPDEPIPDRSKTGGTTGPPDRSKSTGGGSSMSPQVGGDEDTTGGVKPSGRRPDEASETGESGEKEESTTGFKEVIRKIIFDRDTKEALNRRGQFRPELRETKLKSIPFNEEFFMRLTEDRSKPSNKDRDNLLFLNNLSDQKHRFREPLKKVTVPEPTDKKHNQHFDPIQHKRNPDTKKQGVKRFNTEKFKDDLMMTQTPNFLKSSISSYMEGNRFTPIRLI